MRALLGLVGLALVLVACQPDPALSSMPRDAGPAQSGARLIERRGTERLSTAPDEPEGRRTRTATPTRTPVVTHTPTRTPTPTATPTPTGTPTPTTTATPRPDPDLESTLGAFRGFEQLRAHLTGPADLTQEYDGPDKMRVLVARPESAELFVLYGLAYLRQGSYWRPLFSPPAYVLERADRLVPLLEKVDRSRLRRLGVRRARAGRCQEWGVVDGRPNEPVGFCLGLADGWLYRIEMPGGLAVEFFDFGHPIRLPDEPYPIRE